MEENTKNVVGARPGAAPSDQKNTDVATRGWTLRWANGDTVQVGDKATTFRNERVTVTGGAPPRHEGSTGRVYLDDNGEFYPSVIGAEWVRDDARIGAEMNEIAEASAAVDADNARRAAAIEEREARRAAAGKLRKLTPQEKFFWLNGQYSWKAETETQEEGRHRCAIDSASAETWALQNGYTFQVHDDEDYCGDDEAEEALCVDMIDANDHLVQSLCGITLSPDEPTLGYLRVVKAQLADQQRHELEAAINPE